MPESQAPRRRRREAISSPRRRRCAPGFIRRRRATSQVRAARRRPTIPRRVGPDNAPRIGSPLEPVSAESASPRMEVEPPRPSAPSPGEPRRPNPWPWIALAVAVGLVASIAVAAFLLREKPQDLAIKEPVETPAPAPNGPKIAERVGGARSRRHPDAGSSIRCRRGRPDADPHAHAACHALAGAASPQRPPRKLERRRGATQTTPAPARAAMLVATTGVRRSRPSTSVRSSGPPYPQIQGSRAAAA